MRLLIEYRILNQERPPVNYCLSRRLMATNGREVNLLLGKRCCDTAILKTKFFASL